MTHVPSLLSDTLAAVGPEVEARMAALIEDFTDLPLGEEDRLSALAGTIATVAATRYVGHGGIFIAALRGWALEISFALAPELPPLVSDPEALPIAEAQELLLRGIDRILGRMHAARMTRHHRLVTELAIMALLLGDFDAPGVHLVLTAAASACENPAWRPGSAVAVTLSEGAMPLGRDASLAAVAPRGNA